MSPLFYLLSTLVLLSTFLSSTLWASLDHGSGDAGECWIERFGACM